MKTYIFLTFALDTYTGGPSYIRNKKIWLEKQGWNVVVFDSYRQRKGLNDIDFKELKEYCNNRIEELQVIPSWFSRKRRNEILNEIVKRIPLDSEQIVVESNVPCLAEWGELLANKIGASHLIYIISENAVLNTDQEFDYFNYKRKRKELFSISKQAFSSLFSKFLELEENELLYWNAMSEIPPQNIDVPELSKMGHADFTITHFGREKMYFSYLLPELVSFVKSNSSKVFNVIFFGCQVVVDQKIKNLKNQPNVNLYLIKSYFPIPRAVFNISDVVIATAGCAGISFNAGARTISMNVESNRPLGVLGYTTNSIFYASDQYPDAQQELSGILQDLLLNHKYQSTEPFIALEEREHGYEYQMSCIQESKSYYPDVLKIKGPLNFKRRIIYILVKLGFLHLLNDIKLYGQRH